MPQELYLQAGRRIKALRERNGLTREQLAELADISSKHLYEIEIMGKGFSSKTLVGLAKGLEVSCDYVLLGKVGNSIGKACSVAAFCLSGGTLSSLIAGADYICATVLSFYQRHLAAQAVVW